MTISLKGVLMYLYRSDASCNHHLGFEAHIGRSPSRFACRAEDPVSAVGLYQERCVCRGEGQVEPSAHNNAGDEGGFTDVE